MRSEGYTVNKGVNRAIEFKGLKAQWIWWLGGGIVALMALFAGLYIGGAPPVVCLAIVGIAGLVLFRQVYRMSRIYGQYGLMKRTAMRRVPSRLRVGTRKIFMPCKES